MPHIFCCSFYEYSKCPVKKWGLECFHKTCCSQSYSYITIKVIVTEEHTSMCTHTVLFICICHQLWYTFHLWFSPAAALIWLLLAPVDCLSLLIPDGSRMARSTVQSHPSVIFPPSITLMRIRCHSFSCACLLFNWHLIFCSCHFKRENKRLPFIFDAVKRRGLSVTQSDGSIMCFGLQTLLNHLPVSGALHLFLHSGDWDFI